MAWLIETDVLSERTSRTPSQRVLSWLEQNAADVYTSTHVIGELQAGVSALPDGVKKRSLQQWLDRLIEAMEGRILSFNTSVAIAWGPPGIRFCGKGMSHAHAR